MEARFLKFCREHKFFFCSFVLLVFYNLIFAMDCTVKEVASVEYTYHLVDFGMGFCTKLLPGAVCAFFLGDAPSEKAVTIYYIVELLLFYVLLSFLVDRFIHSAPKGYTKLYIVLSLFFITGPCTFSIFAYCLGMLDFSWVLLSAVFIFVLSGKKTKWALPVLFFAALLVHLSAMIAYEELFALLVLYKWSTAENKKDGRAWGGIFWLSLAITGAAFIWFMLFEKKSLTYSVGEFDALMRAKGGNPYYYDYALYGKYNFGDDADVYLNAEYVSLPFFPAIGVFINRVIGQVLFNFKATTFSVSTPPYMSFVLPLLALPIFYVIYRYIIYKFKESREDFKKRFLYFCMGAMYPFTMFCSVFTTVDLVRWNAHAFICLFTLFLYMLYSEKQDAAFIKEKTSGVSPLLIAIYYCIYAVTVFDPY